MSKHDSRPRPPKRTSRSNVTLPAAPEHPRTPTSVTIEAHRSFIRAQQYSRRAHESEQERPIFFRAKILCLACTFCLAPHLLHITIDDTCHVGLPSVVFLPTRQRLHLMWRHLWQLETILNDQSPTSPLRTRTSRRQRCRTTAPKRRRPSATDATKLASRLTDVRR